MRGTIPPVSPYAFMADTVTDLSLLLLLFSLRSFMGHGVYGSESILFRTTVYLYGTKIEKVLIQNKDDLS
jgi:hypothetical protein